MQVWTIFIPYIKFVTEKRTKFATFQDQVPTFSQFCCQYPLINYPDWSDFLTDNFSTDESFLKNLFSNDVGFESRVETLGYNAENIFSIFSLDEQFLKVLVDPLCIVESLLSEFLLANFSADAPFIEELSIWSEFLVDNLSADECFFEEFSRIESLWREFLVSNSGFEIFSADFFIALLCTLRCQLNE